MIGNGCGIQIEREFSAQTHPCSSSCKDFDDFIQFAVVSSDLGTASRGLETASGVLSLARSEANRSRMSEARLGLSRSVCFGFFSSEFDVCHIPLPFLTRDG